MESIWIWSRPLVLVPFFARSSIQFDSFMSPPIWLQIRQVSYILLLSEFLPCYNPQKRLPEQVLHPDIFQIHVVRCILFWMSCGMIPHGHSILVFFQMNSCLPIPSADTAFLKSWLEYWTPLSVHMNIFEQSGFALATASVSESIATCLVVCTSNAHDIHSRVKQSMTLKLYAPSVHSTFDACDIQLP